MVNHKEILRLKILGLAHQEIAASCGCGRNTVTRTLARAREQNLSWDGNGRHQGIRVNAQTGKNFIQMLIECTFTIYLAIQNLI